MTDGTRRCLTFRVPMRHPGDTSGVMGLPDFQDKLRRLYKDVPVASLHAPTSGLGTTQLECHPHLPPAAEGKVVEPPGGRTIALREVG